MEQSTINTKLDTDTVIKKPFSSERSVASFKHDSLSEHYSTPNQILELIITQINQLPFSLLNSCIPEGNFETQKYRLGMVFQDLEKSLKMLNNFLQSERQQLDNDWDLLEKFPNVRQLKLLCAKKDKLLSIEHAIRIFAQLFWAKTVITILHHTTSEILDLPNNENLFVNNINTRLALFIPVFKTFISYINYAIGLENKYADRSFAHFLKCLFERFHDYATILPENIDTLKYQIVFASDLYELKKQKILSDPSNDRMITSNELAQLQIKKIKKIKFQNELYGTLAQQKKQFEAEQLEKEKTEAFEFITQHPNIARLLKTYFEQRIITIIPTDYPDPELFLFKERQNFYYTWYHNFINGKDIYKLNINVPKQDIKSKPKKFGYNLEYPTVTIKKRIIKLRPMEGNINDPNETQGFYSQDQYVAIDAPIQETVLKSKKENQSQVDNRLQNNNTIIREHREKEMIEVDENRLEQEWQTTYREEQTVQQNNEHREENDKKNEFKSKRNNIETETVSMLQHDSGEDNMRQNTHLIDRVGKNKLSIMHDIYNNAFPAGITLITSSALGFGLYHALEKTQAFNEAPEANLCVIIYTAVLAALILIALFYQYKSSIQPEMQR